jgi:hypothetical protein
MPRSLQNELRAVRPKIILAEDESDECRAFIHPMGLKPEDPKRIARAFERVLRKRDKS